MKTTSTLLRHSLRVHAFLVFGLIHVNSASAQILPANRTPTGQGNWTGVAGVPGGIPTVTNIYTTISAGASLSTIQSAINSCPSNKVVLLSAGTYNLSGTLQISRNGVVLRGAGTSATILNFSSGYLYIGDQSWYSDFASPNSSRHVAWNSGLAQGSTQITVSSVGDLQVGELLMMDQQNDANVDYVGHCNGPVPGLYSSVANPGIGHDRWQYQVNRVTSINGTTITLALPVFLPVFASSHNPQVWWYGAQPWQRSGVENLTINGAGGSSQGIYFQNVYGCWAYNVNVANCRYGINAFFACNVSIAHCSVSNPSLPSDSYNYQLITSSGLLVENNICVGGTLMMNGISGSVIAYNYLQGTTGSSGYMQGGLLTHGANPNMNLYEGNYAPGVWWENCWGSSEYNTAFRNRLYGNDQYPNSAVVISYDKEAINANQYQRYESVIGNLMGNSATTGYEDSGTSYTYHGTTGRIYYLGEVAPGNAYSDNSTAFDPLVVSTLVRAMNWDTVTSTNGGLVSNGYIIRDLPASLYLTSKPSFFGRLNWPPYNPTVTSSAALDRTNIPAGYRYVYGVDPVASGSANQPPTVVAAATPLSGTIPLTVACSSSGSSDPEGAPLTYSWNFGDGSSSTNANPSHIYSITGSFSITLTVSDGTNSVTSIGITINPTAPINQPPVAVENANPTSGLAPLTVTFSSTGSTDPEGAGLTYSWAFGDGNTSTAANPSHTFANAGNYTVLLAVSDGTNVTTVSNFIINATGLVAAYGFEETSGPQVFNTVSGQADGSFTNATPVPGQYGSALGFNGTNAVVSITNALVSGITSNLTIEAWVKPAAILSWRPVIGKAKSQSQLAYVVQGVTPQNSLPSLYLSPGPNNLSGIAPLPTNAWSHLAATFDGSNLCLYVNGTLVASQQQTDALTPANTPLTIGSDGLLQAFWSGAIDEVRIYNTILSAAAIQSDMNTPIVPLKPAPPQNLRVVPPP